jgi:hypothetical protein
MSSTVQTQQEQMMQARTTYPNTPESDQMAEVMHTVTDDNGKEHTLYAACPIDAIEKFRLMQLSGGNRHV